MVCEFKRRGSRLLGDGNNSRGSSATMRLNKDQVMRIKWLSGNKNFICKRKKLVFNTFFSFS